MKERVSYLLFVVALLVGKCVAQFSPGELSRAHEQFEGMNNCLQCHETGNEISGKQCASCHSEIQKLINSKHGFHFRNVSKRCVDCHKEHLGRDAKTVQFDRKAFDHALTGFSQTGKHASLDCADCHAVKNIKDAQILKLVNEKHRSTFLGLGTTCVSCHQDKHSSTVGSDCQRCHTTEKWSTVVRTFDHSKTEFQLLGKHSAVECSRCHTGLGEKTKDKPLLFTTKEFRDCAPCHSSPHSSDFVRGKTCSTCHTMDGWKNSSRTSGKFNHDQTAFTLIGRHATVACEKCHKGSAKATSGKSLKPAHGKCTDCHTDYHKGDFAQKYDSSCEKCHTVFGFAPATFTVAMHSQSRFALTGAHLATVCARCHTNDKDGRKQFRFANTRCESCHRDKHGGQFSKEMASQSCGACHSTADWLPKSFDHAKTNFPLVGKHSNVKCEKCHKPKTVNSTEAAQYKGTNMKCQGCHEDAHAGQFLVKDETNCISCHRPDGWQKLVFDHNRQSTFVLDGGHLRIECRACHREERRGEKTFVRYKPLSSKCESCHAKNSFGNG